MKLAAAERWHKVLLLTGSVSFALLLVEGLLRLKVPPFFFSGDYSRSIVLKKVRPTLITPELGWSPLPNASFVSESFTSNIDSEGLRINGNGFIPSSESIVTVGNSFTFGDDVDDQNTWPSMLERMTNIRVRNGGVFGYGVDQTYLRAKQLLQRYRPNVLIFSLIPVNLPRMARSVAFGIPKPYFTLEEGELKLHPAPERTLTNQLPVLKPLMARSLLLHSLMDWLSPAFWGDRSYSLLVENKYPEVACEMFKELSRWNKTKSVRTLLLVQGTTADEPQINAELDGALRCAEIPDSMLLDLRPMLAEEKRRNPKFYESLFAGHMTATGNAWVAGRIAQKWFSSPSEVVRNTAPPEV